MRYPKVERFFRPIYSSTVSTKGSYVKEKITKLFQATGFLSLLELTIQSQVKHVVFPK